jgi:predicted ATPase/DNA-binding SARP family transcriptional activator
MGRVRYGILGPTQALREDGGAVPLGGGRLRALLAALALEPGRVRGPEALIGEVWGDADAADAPGDATAALQALVGRLRRALGRDAVLSVAGGYRLAAGRDDVDLYRFERLAGEGARALADGDPAKAVGVLEEALALWRGPAVADLPDRAALAARYDALRLDARRDRLAAELALGRATQALPELTGLAAEHALNEPLRALHIRALREAGRPADALEAYEAVRRTLAETLGADPGPELRALHAELLGGSAPGSTARAAGGVPRCVPGAPAPAPTGPAAGAVARNLPIGATRNVPGAPARATAQPPARETPATPAGPGTSAPASPAAAPAAAPTAPAAHAPAPGNAADGPGNRRARLTSFVGREAELTALRADLAAARLVTLTGPGGTGKTRLSQELGDLAAGEWPDGVWYVELAPVDDPRTVPEAAVNALRLREVLLTGVSSAERTLTGEEKARAVDPTRQLTEYCASRRLLLVLDNCEHLIDAAAALADQLLTHCPGLTVLATSREPLGVPGELVRPVGTLPESKALRLLADRGAAARPGFVPAEDPHACAELCRRLDGLPLAIELAAARLRGLTPRQLADRLDDRFRILTGGSRTALPRQQTLRAVVDWSWDLLEEDERVLLRRLAVFAGGWTLEAAERICGDAPADASATGSAATEPGPASAAFPPAPAPAPAEADADTGALVSALVSAAPAPYAAPTAPVTPPHRIDPADTPLLLASLVDKSLVLADHSPDGTRYRMLETIAEYSRERLEEAGEAAAVERRHLTHFREFARTADPELRGPRQLEWLERLEREHENIRAALRRAVAARDEQEALSLTLGCSWFWEVRNYRTEMLTWPSAVMALGENPFAPGPDGKPPGPGVPLTSGPLDMPPPLPPEQLDEARRWVRIGDAVARFGRDDEWGTPERVALGEAMIAAYPPGLPQAATRPGIFRAFGCFLTTRFDEMGPLLDSTVGACRRQRPEREWELALSLQFRAKVRNDMDDQVDAATEDIREAREIFARLGDRWGIAEVLAAEAELAGNLGDWERVAECCREAIGLAEHLGARQQVPVLTVRLGDAVANTGDPAEGERLILEGIDAAKRFGSPSWEGSIYGRLLLITLRARRGDLPGAHEMVDSLLDNPPTGLPGFVLGLLGSLKGWLLGLGGEPERGLALHREALTTLDGHPLTSVIAPRVGVIMLIPGISLLAGLAAQRTSPETARLAARLAGAHDMWRRSACNPWETESLAISAATVRDLLGGEGYEAAYEEGRRTPLEEALRLMRGMPEPGGGDQSSF